MTARRSTTEPSWRDDILEYVDWYWRHYGYGPTRREIADATGLGLATVQYHVQVLLENGDLMHKESSPRTLRLA